ncbi:MAG: YbaK/EbsC family protein [Candidatus Aenigmatarchaeota archaeon]|nr:MAG: YbaK/EbsC family protein [Candidatus Aenigmarchaeota archaeon]
MGLEVEKRLEEKGISYRLIELEGRAVSVKDVLALAKEKIKLEEVCKTIVAKDGKGNSYAFVLKGNQKIDMAKAERLVGGGLRIARPEEVEDAAGVEPGAVCPLLLEIPILVDRRVLDTERINFGSGDHLYGVEISTKDLEKVIEFRVADFAKV